MSSSEQSPPATNKPPEPFEVKVRQTTIKIYPLKRGEFQFRYYLGGKPKRATRSTRAAIVKEATRVATDLDNGRLQAGAMQPAEVQSYTHARRLLTPADPPLHVIVEEWQRFKAACGNASLDDVAATWKRSRPKGEAALVPGASMVSRLAEQMIESLKQSATASGSDRNWKNFRQDLPRFCLRFGREHIGDVASDQIQDWIRTLGVGARRQDNLRERLVTFFHFARDRGHLPESSRVEPEKVPRLSKGHQDISFYRPGELRRFLAAVDERWLPMLAISVFAGIRTSEIGRMTWEMFDWEGRRIYLPANKSLKVRRPRRVPIEDNLFRWLAPYHTATGRLYDLKDPDGAWGKYTQTLATAAGIPWRNNNSRHSYGTYQMALTDNYGNVAAWMGSSEAKIKSNYDGVASPAEGKEYLGIIPGADRGNIIVMPGAKARRKSA